jgi:nitroreductase/NAD-dependent dihydropyrimidine dehydrogenase PreA subunit
MSLFVVNKEKCTRDGICVAECPIGLIELKDKKSVPEPIDRADEMCINCGHCVAVCPHGAFSLATMKPEDCPPVRKDLTLNVEHVEHLLQSRRSIRTYQDKAISPEKLEKLIDIARCAPTGGNSQLVKWIVVNSRERVRNIAGEMIVDCMRYLISDKHPLGKNYNLPFFVKAWDEGKDLISRGAPGLAVTHAPKDHMMAQTDSAIALTFLDLAAPSFGLGTCWAGFFMIAAALWPPLQEAIGLPEGNACFGAMLIGYKKYEYLRIPLRKPAEITWR